VTHWTFEKSPPPSGSTRKDITKSFVHFLFLVLVVTRYDLNLMDVVPQDVQEHQQSWAR